MDAAEPKYLRGKCTVRYIPGMNECVVRFLLVILSLDICFLSNKKEIEDIKMQQNDKSSFWYNKEFQDREMVSLVFVCVSLSI